MKNICELQVEDLSGLFFPHVVITIIRWRSKCKMAETRGKKNAKFIQKLSKETSAEDKFGTSKHTLYIGG